MKEVIIRDRNNKIISDKNLYEDPTEFLELNKKYNTWGRSERWVRAKFETTIQTTEESEPLTTWVYPDEYYEDEDVIDTQQREVWSQVDPDAENDSGVMDLVTYVLLKTDYTIEIKDYKRVPTSVSPMQIRLALNRTGLRQIVEEAVANANQDIKDMWEFATEFRRDYPVLLELAQAMNITEDQLDDLFILAETL